MALNPLSPAVSQGRPSLPKIPPQGTTELPLSQLPASPVAESQNPAVPAIKAGPGNPGGNLNLLA